MTANRQLEIKEYFSREYFLWISFLDKLLYLTKNELTNLFNHALDRNLGILT